MSDIAISVKNLSKSYNFYKSPWHRLGDWCSFGLHSNATEFWALKDISFDLPKGECLGVIGYNGAGKSTLLKILSRALYQTEGEFNINGRLVSLLELGTGFNNELSGIENIYISAQLLGFPADYVTMQLPKITDFAEIGDFINRPVRTYSSGMFVRLAFSLFAHLEPEVYLVDEALAVGDVFFQQKCFQRFMEMRQQGNTVIIVSHDMSAITQLCDRAILLQNGYLVFDGTPEAAVQKYYSGQFSSDIKAEDDVEIGDENKTSVFFSSTGDKDSFSADFPPPPASREEFLATVMDIRNKERHGNGFATILGAKIVDRSGMPCYHFDYGDSLFVQTLFQANENLKTVSNGIHIYDRTGVLVFAEGSINENINIGPLRSGEAACSMLKVHLNLHPGEYSLTVGVSTPNTEEDVGTGCVFDRVVGALYFQVRYTWDRAKDLAPFYGITNLNMEVSGCKLPE